jgi:hypothetical protein
MIHFQYKGKGLLILVYFFVPFFSILILSEFIFPYFIERKNLNDAIMIAIGVSLIISGFWTYLTTDEYYTDEHGEKKYVYFDNQFMFLDMKLWSYIFWVVGGMLLVYVVKLIPGLMDYV